MSRYKDEQKLILGEIDLNSENCLSIGAQFDDRKYFKSNKIGNFVTLDSVGEMGPNIIWDMNRQIMDDEGGTQFHEHYNKYDTVLALNLWEYIYDPVTAHKNIHFFMKSGGVYMGTYPFVYGKHNPAGTDYLRYTDEGIRKILTQSLFSQIEIKPIKSNDLLTEYYLSEGMRIRKDVDHNVAGYFVTARK